MVGDKKQDEIKVPSLKLKASRKSAAMTGVVTERDASALLWVLHQGVMTVDQLFRAVYRTSQTQSPRYAYTRIQFLEQSGFLVSLKSAHRKDRFLKIAKLGQSYLLSQSIQNVTRVLSVPSTLEIPHAEILTEIRIAIQESGKHGDSLWWRGECLLSEDDEFPKERFRDLMPDAIWMTKSSRRVAIEFERARKGITRVRKKVEGFEEELNRSDRVFDRVLWVAVDGAYRDVKKALSNRETQTLRTVGEFMSELKGVETNA